ncbi:MAG: WbqC family protein [Vicinamibacterales bacterium]
MRVGLIQSNYIPWRGYFDVIHDVDVFVFHDDLQYTKGDWRNRNFIKTPTGPQWLTIPVGTSEHRLICEVPLPDSDWAVRHWRRLEQHYARAPHFGRYRDLLRHHYFGCGYESLSAFNQGLTMAIARDVLGIRTRFRDSREFRVSGVKSQRVLDLVSQAGASTYVSGPAARAYIEEAAFDAAGIALQWKDYDGYPDYPQFHPPFAGRVSILDLIFHAGPDAGWFVWGWRDGVRRAA